MKMIAILLMVFITSLYHEPSGQAQAAPFSPDRIVLKTITIANGQTVSAASDIGGYQLVGISLPATMTGTTLTLQVSTTFAGTYNAAYNSAGAVSYTIAGARYLVFPSSDTVGIRFLKLVSGTAEAGARTITMHLLAR